MRLTNKIGRPAVTWLVVSLSVSVISCASYASKTKLSLGLGYENIYKIQQTQGRSMLFVRLGIARDLYLKNNVRYGFEAGARTGYQGLLDLSDSQQENVGGPDVVVHSGPRVDLLATAIMRLSDAKSNGVAKFGFDFSLLNFGRCDINGVPAVNIIGQIGLGRTLSDTSEVTVTVGASLPTTRVTLGYETEFTISTPYPNASITVSWLTTL